MAAARRAAGRAREEHEELEEQALAAIRRAMEREAAAWEREVAWRAGRAREEEVEEEAEREEQEEEQLAAVGPSQTQT